GRTRRRPGAESRPTSAGGPRAPEPPRWPRKGRAGDRRGSRRTCRGECIARCAGCGQAYGGVRRSPAGREKIRAPPRAAPRHVSGRRSDLPLPRAPLDADVTRAQGPLSGLGARLRLVARQPAAAARRLHLRLQRHLQAAHGGRRSVRPLRRLRAVPVDLVRDLSARRSGLADRQCRPPQEGGLPRRAPADGRRRLEPRPLPLRRPDPPGRPPGRPRARTSGRRLGDPPDAARRPDRAAARRRPRARGGGSERPFQGRPRSAGEPALAPLLPDADPLPAGGAVRIPGRPARDPRQSARAVRPRLPAHDLRRATAGSFALAPDDPRLRPRLDLLRLAVRPPARDPRGGLVTSLNENAIEVEGVVKLYRRTAPRDQFRTLKSALVDRSLTSTLKREEAIVALDGVDFAVGKGEAFGVVGGNGSGKSTLLKLIAGMLKPSSGSIRVAGRVAALIELGAGFHPEISGRENVY